MTRLMIAGAAAIMLWSSSTAAELPADTRHGLVHFFCSTEPRMCRRCDRADRDGHVSAAEFSRLSDEWIRRQARRARRDGRNGR